VCAEAAAPHAAPARHREPHRDVSLVGRQHRVGGARRAPADRAQRIHERRQIVALLLRQLRTLPRRLRLVLPLRPREHRANLIRHRARLLER